jgi:hypothetical protein
MYKEEFRRQAVEMVIHGGKGKPGGRANRVAANTASTCGKQAYLRQQAPSEIGGQ